MALKHPCYLELSPNKDLLKIVHKSGMVIANLVLYDEKFAQRLMHAYDRLGLLDIPRPTTPFFGEVEEVKELEVLEDLIRKINLIVEFNAVALKDSNSKGDEKQ